MHLIKLDMYQAFAVAAVMLVIGQFLVNRIALLRRYCIPAPVVGGLLFAVAHCVLRGCGVVEFEMDTTLQNVFMTAFFCSVGFLAALNMLKKGGVALVKFLLLAVVIIVLQDLIGGCGAKLFGLDGRLGLAMGSIPLVGGHGTSASFGVFLEERGVHGAVTVAVASATYGLVAGCMIGGPIASSKIRRYGLRSAVAAPDGDAAQAQEESGTLRADKMLSAAICLVIAVGAGTLVSALIDRVLTMPSYIGAMLVAAVFRNVADGTGRELPMNEISSLGSVSLSLFLSLAMINLKLWQLVDLAVPMIVILLLQTVMMFFYASFVVFPVMGRDYDAAAMATGFCGFGMGATPNAMANMQAVTKLYGPAPLAFMVVPLAGSLFIDFINATIITAFASLL